MSTSFNDDYCIPTTCPPPSFIWATMTCPLCLLTIAGYIMLLISPLTRALALDFLNLLYYIAINTVQFAWHVLGTSPRELEQLKQSWATMQEQLMRERGEAIKSRSEMVDVKVKLEASEKKLCADYVELQKVLNTTLGQLMLHQKQVKEAPVYQEKLATVHGLQDQIIKLQQALGQQASGKVDALRDVKKAMTREMKVLALNGQLEADIKQQAEKHKREIFCKDQVVVLHHRVVEVLHYLAEQTDSKRLIVEVLFTKTLKLAVIRPVDLGIGQRRFGLLCQYIAAGMRRDLPVQPQVYECGVCFYKQPHLLSGLTTQNTTTIHGPCEMPTNNPAHPFQDSDLGPTLGGSQINAGNIEQQQHQSTSPDFNTSLFASFRNNNKSTTNPSIPTLFSNLGKSPASQPTSNLSFTAPTPFASITNAMSSSDNPLITAAKITTTDTLMRMVS